MLHASSLMLSIASLQSEKPSSPNSSAINALATSEGQNVFGGSLFSRKSSRRLRSAMICSTSLRYQKYPQQQFPTTVRDVVTEKPLAKFWLLHAQAMPKLHHASGEVPAPSTFASRAASGQDETRLTCTSAAAGG